MIINSAAPSVFSVTGQQRPSDSNRRVTHVDVVGGAEINELDLLDGTIAVGVDEVKQLPTLLPRRSGRGHRA